MHQTILGSRIQEQGRCLAQLQAQVFSHGLDLEPEEEQTKQVSTYFTQKLHGTFNFNKNQV